MRALVREVSPRFARALCAVAPDPPIDVELAQRQHLAYVAALSACGVEVTRISNVEDPAVVAREVALITRPGAESRRRETAHTKLALDGEVALMDMAAPATLDGGDCMRVGNTIFVGRSARTNQAGIARLAEVFEPRG